MSTLIERLPLPLKSLIAQGRARWALLGGRERQMVSTMGVAIGLALAWMILLQPALRTLKTAPAELEQLDAQLHEMQRQADESRILRDTPRVPPAQAEAALRSATERLGQAARLAVQGDRATLTLNGVSGDALVAWLDGARHAARARPIEARLARSGTGYSGTLVLALAVDKG